MAQDFEEKRHNLRGLSPLEKTLDFVLQFLLRDRRYIVTIDRLENCSDEELEDIFVGLQRLRKERTVLLCHPARIESRYQRVAQEKLGTGSVVSLDAREHDKEMESFIRDDIAKINASRHLSPKLEDLVVQQLVAGSQGM